MHMTDALLSPAVGGVMTAVSAAAIGYSAKKTAHDEQNDKKIPMMGVMGAFVFAAQMINFTVPGTGSSGHIGGGILLAALLGPYPALLTLASVLLVQCLLFADGGLLAFGCNVFNIGICASLLAYGLVYKPIIKRGISRKTITLASVASVVLGLQVGAFCVVLETVASGVTELPLGIFASFMQPIHLAIGLAEGFATAGVLCFVHRMRPELLNNSIDEKKDMKSISNKKILIIFLILTVLMGGVLSLFASSSPDGLEWSIENIIGTSELEREGTVHDMMANTVGSTAIMPGYTFSDSEKASAAETATAGIVGCMITIILAGAAGLIIHTTKKIKSSGR